MNNFARIRGVGLVKTFSPRTAAPTVEDTGTAQLGDGEAAVRLDPVFAASMEPRASYRVFITPDGNSNGLYVAEKTAAGFLVRESKGGRSTVSFDYRVVATSIGQLGQRMSVADGAMSPRSVHVTPTRNARISPPAPPKLPRVPRVPSMRVPVLSQLKLPRRPSQAVLAPGRLR